MNDFMRGWLLGWMPAVAGIFAGLALHRWRTHVHKFEPIDVQTVMRPDPQQSGGR
jgi:hypothetical protein